MCHFQEGITKDIAIIFSCPGRKEKDEGIPAAGVTGKNLEELIRILSCSAKSPFNGLSKKDLRITNSWSNVEYEGLTGRREVDFQEILQKDNLDRLYEEIKDIKKIILCCGERAKVAILALKYADKIKNSVRIIFVEHLGMQGINQIDCDLDGNEIISAKSQKSYGRNEIRKGIGNENTVKRLKVIAKKIEEQY